MTMMHDHDKPSPEDVLEHFGIKGQKWGVRRGRSSTGITRSRGAILDRNAHISNRIDQALTGQKFKVRVGIAQKLIGKEKYRQSLQKRVSTLDKQSSRIINGKINAKDRLDIYGHAYVRTFDVLVTRNN